MLPKLLRMWLACPANKLYFLVLAENENYNSHSAMSAEYYLLSARALTLWHVRHPR